MRTVILAASLFIASCASAPGNKGFAFFPSPPPAVGDAHPFRVALVQPHTTATLAAPHVFTERSWIPSDVSSVRVHVIQKNLASGSFTGFNNTVTLPALAIGTPGDSQGLSWSGSPTVYSNFFLNYPPFWNSTAWTPVTRDANGFIMIAFAVPAGTYPVETTHVNGGVNANSSDVAGLSGVVATTGSTGTVPFCIVVEYKTAAPRLVVISDSIHRGPDVSNNGAVHYQDTLVKLGPTAGVAVSINGVPGLDAQTWALDSIPWLFDHSTMRDALVLFALGFNDVNANTGYAAVTQYFHQLLRTIRSFRPAAVLQSTITPYQGFSGSQNASRAGLNGDIRAGNFDVDGILDADLLLRDSGNVNQLNATYSGTGDVTGYHLNAAGLGVLMAALPSAVGRVPSAHWQWQLSGSTL